MFERVLSPARHESSDVGFRPMVVAASLAAAFLAIVLLSALALYPHQTTADRVSEPVPAFAAPQLQPSPRADMVAFAALQRRQLEGAYWIDRDRGTVHLPIDLAMRKLVEEGRQGWPR